MTFLHRCLPARSLSWRCNRRRGKRCRFASQRAKDIERSRPTSALGRKRTMAARRKADIRRSSGHRLGTEQAGNRFPLSSRRLRRPPHHGAGVASAATLHFTADLKGSSEVPANTTTGTGQVAATLDTASDVFTYHVTYGGLTGPAVAAHFHGPALPGVGAPPVITMKSLASPIDGTATLTAAQAADLQAGKWYFNVHTTEHKGGEIRGQL